MLFATPTVDDKTHNNPNPTAREKPVFKSVLPQLLFPIPKLGAIACSRVTAPFTVSNCLFLVFVRKCSLPANLALHHPKNR